MTAVFIGLLALAALAWVLTAARGGGVLMERSVEGDELADRKAAALAALADLDEELKAGKITPEDHTALRSTYEVEAVAVLREIDDAAKR